MRNLNFQFRDSDLEKEANEAKEEACNVMENYLELAAQDWEQRPQAEDDDDEDEDE